MIRPVPPTHLIDPGALIDEARFAPDHNLREWVFETFIRQGAALENVEHAHLAEARIGFLWSSHPSKSKGRLVIGQSELMPPNVMNKWGKERAEQQIREWFGDLPDFLITLDAQFCTEAIDAQFCALVEHELYHCAQARDMYGDPKFREDGRPAYALRGHDVEEFIGVVRRYGVVSDDVRALVDAANAKPEVSQARLTGACGTCLRMVA